MRMLWRALIAVGALFIGLWMHRAVEPFATDMKLFLARSLIWGVIIAAYLLWFARRRLAGALFRLAARIEQRRGTSLPRRESGSTTERVAVCVFAILCASLPIVAIVSADTFVRLFDEDGPFEMATAICYGISAAACVTLALRAQGHRSLQIALGLLAMLFFVVGGEEISWGQRLFDFGTPKELKAINVQGEFTLHNIYSISLFTYPALATTAMLLLVAPLLSRFSAGARRIFDAMELPVAPPLCAVLYGLMLTAYFIVGFRLGTPTPLPISYSKYVPHFDDEMMEFLISVLFTVFAVSNWRFQLPGTREAEGSRSAGSVPVEAG